MVLAERNSEIVRNGRRSRGPSPNGHGTGIGGGTPDTSSDDDNSIKRNGKSKPKQSEYEEKIRVGRDYQAVCPPMVSEIERKPEILNDRALLVWSPTKEIPDNKLEEYITVAKEKYGYNGEQALGMLFWHKHDLERAVMDLANFTPFPDDWTVEDKVLFEQAFQFHGKSFHRIRQMLPDKSIPSLVKYYYSWKKSRHRQSVMDRQEKLKACKEGSEGSDNGSNDDSDNDDKDQAMASSSGLQESKLSVGGGDTLSKNNKTNNTPMMSLVNSNPSTQTGSSTITNAAHNNNNNNAGGSASSVLTTASTGTTAAATTNASAAAAVAATTTTNNSIASSSTKRQQQIQQQNSSNNITANGQSNCNSNSTDINLVINANPTSSSVASAASMAITSQTNGGCCAGCGVACNILNTTPHGKLCNSCHHHWRRTGNKRPTSGPYFGKRYRDRNADRHKRKPPRGMHINHDDIVALASSNNNHDELLANTEREIVSLLSQVQLNKQNISTLKRKNSESMEDIRPNDNTNRINSRWSNDELLLAVRGVRKYGKDFQTIADTIGTKTEAHVRTFYVNYRRRYNLDQVLKDYEAEKEATSAAAAAAVAHQKDDQKKKESPVRAEETNSSDKGILNEKNSNKVTESLLQTTTTTTTAAEPQKDNIILEIDLDNETLDGPPMKRLALSAQDMPKPSAV